jgi:Cu-Zn family superoxide dismutase
MKKIFILFVVFISLGFLTIRYAGAEDITVTMNLVTPQGVGKEIGTVTLSDSPYGLILQPHLKGLQPGIHGFHVHQNPDCGPAKEGEKMIPGLAAGGHFDPGNTGRHEGPYGNGHLGDLPVLIVDRNGEATLPILAPRLKTSDVRGHSLMIHAGGDNYSDKPKKLGGGGARVACGAIR